MNEARQQSSRLVTKFGPITAPLWLPVTAAAKVQLGQIFEETHLFLNQSEPTADILYRQITVIEGSVSEK